MLLQTTYILHRHCPTSSSCRQSSGPGRKKYAPAREDEPVEMDVAPFAENGRTFLPARWIAEPLGAQVEWDEETQEVTEHTAGSCWSRGNKPCSFYVSFCFGLISSSLCSINLLPAYPFLVPLTAQQNSPSKALFTSLTTK